MKAKSGSSANQLRGIVKATGEEHAFSVGDKVKIQTRAPVDHYRVQLLAKRK